MKLIRMEVAPQADKRLLCTVVFTDEGDPKSIMAALSLSFLAEPNEDWSHLHLQEVGLREASKQMLALSDEAKAIREKLVREKEREKY